jgi:hypothetical protein
LSARSLLKDARNCHLLQGDITRPPLREGVFDIIYSIGVLHHLEFPEKGFEALKPLLSKSGQVWIWVYGLEGMSLTYRFSHLVWIRRLTQTWNLEAKFRLCRGMALVFRLLYLYPLLCLKQVLPVNALRYFPYHEWTSCSGADMTYIFFDRLQPPFTHYLSKEQIRQYFHDMKQVSISTADRNGWIAKARKP